MRGCGVLGKRGGGMGYCRRDVMDELVPSLVRDVIYGCSMDILDLRLSGSNDIVLA